MTKKDERAQEELLAKIEANLGMGADTSEAQRGKDPGDSLEEALEEEPAPWYSKKRAMAAIFAGGLVLAIGAPYVYVAHIEPALIESDLKSEVRSSTTSSAPITVGNGSLVPFGAPAIEGVYEKQQALGSVGVATDPAAFIFTNGEISEERKVVDIYLDFYNQRGRDFALLNQELLKNLVESGTIELRIHPVPTGSAFSLYAPEALAQVFATSPDSAWSVFIELLKASITLETNELEDVVTSVVGAANQAGGRDVSEASVRNGTFASWILTVADDPKLAVGYYPPVLYVDNVIVDQDVYDLNSTDSVRKAIIGF